jgi:hypothetical protein
MRKARTICLIVAALMLAGMATSLQAEEFKLTLGGATYTKWLWGNQRYDGSMYNFTTVPGEGYGDNGQGTELELFINARVSKAVEVKARIHSRFNQNQWTNFGGWGSNNPPNTVCVGGDCGEFDSRSNQYIKLRGATVLLTPGYSWLDLATIGASDLGMFDPYSIGKIRYIDRDNASGIFFQGSLGDKALRYDFARISLPRLWAGPGYQTGEYTAQDGAYVLQLGYEAGAMFDIKALYYMTDDIEVDADDLIFDDGREVIDRFTNDVYGLKVGIHPLSILDISALYYHSDSESNCDLAPCNWNIYGGYSPVLGGDHSDDLWKLNVDLNDPFGIGLSFNLEAFDIGADYVSLLAARRESDVLLTEGFDAAYPYPGPGNAKYGVFGNRTDGEPNAADWNRSVIGFGGWDGNAQQLATINVDNEFSDFDEPLAETVIGWKGFTIVPVLSAGNLELSAEYTMIDYNQNWEVWGDPTGPMDSSNYPAMELDSGVGHNFRNAFAPFTDKETTIALVKGKYLLDVGRGLDIFGKIKMIDETDKRMNDPRYLPYEAGDCPGGGQACAGNTNYYSGSFSTSAVYFNPGVITVNGVTGYQWKPFDSIADDDRDMSYTMFQLGAGYQFTDELYLSAYYENYDVDLQDGNTAFGAYNVHELASGKHTRDKFSIGARYFLAGMEFGLTWQFITGEFDPDFGDGFVVQYADEGTAQSAAVEVGSAGFRNRFGGWNSLETREFDHQRLKAFIKVVF